MSELVVRNQNLPSTLEDLTKLVIVGREQLNAIRAELRAAEKVGIAAEYRKELMTDAQDKAETILDAEVRIGEIMLSIPKAKGGKPFHKNHTLRSGADSKNLDPWDIPDPWDMAEEAEEEASTPYAKTKREVINESGLSEDMVERFQQLAEHPELVSEAKSEARENDDIVTRTAVLNKIKELNKKPHVANNSGENEWYTPKDYIDRARQVMGTIDLDPASNEIANNVVQADKYFTVADDGLAQKWSGNVWMNPPYASELIGKFSDKLIKDLPDIDNAIVLVNNATETDWFNTLVHEASAVCFPDERVKFYAPDGRIAQPLQGQAILYYGQKTKEFIDAFGDKGWCAYPA